MSGTGDPRGAAGVKTAKLCAEQDQIGKRLNAASIKFPGRSLKGISNGSLRGMITTEFVRDQEQLGTESGLQQNQHDHYEGGSKTTAFFLIQEGSDQCPLSAATAG